MLRLSAAILFMGGPILALIFGSWGLGAFVFGLGADSPDPARRASQRTLPRGRTTTRRRLHRDRRPDAPAVRSVTLTEEGQLRMCRLRRPVYTRRAEDQIVGRSYGRRSTR